MKNWITELEKRIGAEQTDVVLGTITIVALFVTILASNWFVVI